ncbi:SMI1/KNR4 family protein [Lysobacter enzymogenes]|uniref:SMI1/KNR4 family protein n=1 Tax=Lysobacter enzymogenes TaxID=69 RepID=UPI001AF310B0|nr:SMI1/KNR4 family protein [Lysobacter enzymogenes]QQP99807.1 SMI1/KNR4 family protein [Lysobacter enzymogenes]
MSEAALARAERWYGAALAAPLRAFVLAHGGREIGAVRLYPADEIVERNETYETREYCPGYLTVGDDGGGRAVVVHAALTPPTVFVVGHGSMSEADFVAVGSGLQAWIEGGCAMD